MKSGTTTLEGVLARLPGVAITAEKESSNFLSKSTSVRAAIQIRESCAAAAGEVSTAYMQRPAHEVDIKDVRNLLGREVRLIGVLRDPVARALSHWRHWEQLGRNPTGRIEDLLPDPHYRYVQFSRYLYQLTPWLEHFEPSEMLLLRLEDYAVDPAAWHGAVARHLGLPDAAAADLQPLHLNNASERVVSRGLGARVSQSPIYRSFRPFVPSSTRRLGARTLGGKKGGAVPSALPPDARERFISAIAGDARELSSIWSHLSWPHLSGNPQ